MGWGGSGRWSSSLSGPWGMGVVRVPRVVACMQVSGSRGKPEVGACMAQVHEVDACMHGPGAWGRCMHAWPRCMR